MRCLLLCCLLLCGFVQGQTLPDKFKQLSYATSWQKVAAIQLNFSAYHPQGMVKIDNYFFLSSVEVTQAPRNGSSGEGIGHLFKLDSTGKLISSINLGEGAVYHPGGIDYDGESIWIPVAEYRPDSKSIIYKVNPNTLAIKEIMRYPEHIGGIVHNTEAHKLLGISWGSRNFYQWPVNSKDKASNTEVPPDKLRIPNPSFYIDYQDCHYVGQQMMLCSGLQKYSNGTQIIRLGGIDLISLKDYRPIHQVPIRLWSPTGLPMTNNPFWLESTAKGIRTYFIPDDDKAATLFIYEAVLEP
ncbi:DUF6454 family protein [Emticicia sp. 17c]|uniref:DUF6454 family protein n=1 Tax=Emticicia sp. 17c TaxID=3127704 RepID=UPI00301D8BA7